MDGRETTRRELLGHEPIRRHVVASRVAKLDSCGDGDQDEISTQEILFMGAVRSILNAICEGLVFGFTFALGWFAAALLAGAVVA